MRLAVQPPLKMMHRVEGRVAGTTQVGQVDVAGKETLQFLWEEISKAVNLNEVNTLLEGTHAGRLSDYPATEFPEGTLFFETDRTVIYRVSGGVWKYTVGMYSAVHANRPTDLGTDDAGFLLWITTQNHKFRWAGSIWTFIDSEGGYIADRVSVPTSLGWQLCDGTATDYLQISGADIVVTAFTTPDTTTAPSGVYFKSIAAYTGVINAANGPVISGNVANTTATNIAAATDITVNSKSLNIVTRNVEDAGANPVSVVESFDDPHDHDVTDPTHNHTQDIHTHAATGLVVDATAQPRNMGVLKYFRR